MLVDDGLTAESPDVGEGLLLRGLVPASSVPVADTGGSNPWRAYACLGLTLGNVCA